MSAALAAPVVRDAKRRFLDKAVVDGVGGAHSTGVRYWVTFMVHVMCMNPIQPPDASLEVRRVYEECLEDCAVWVFTCRPSGRFVSARSVGKYVSSVRGWYHGEYSATLGLGAAAGRMARILKGAMREVAHPPPRERLGLSPDRLARAHELLRADGSTRSLMLRSAASFCVGAIARGCEVALDDSRGEKFDTEQHMVPADVAPFVRSSVVHARVRMRKRKDLKVLRGKHSQVVLAGGGTVLDPVRDLRAWLAERRRVGISEERPLFCWPDGVGLTVTQLRDEVRLLVSALGLDASLFGAHSLRIGGATAALAAGVPPQLIRLMGRWSSDVYEIYCRMSVESALGVGARLCSQTVETLEEGFHCEHLELTDAEMGDGLRGLGAVSEGEEGEGGEDWVR